MFYSIFFKSDSIKKLSVISDVSAEVVEIPVVKNELVKEELIIEDIFIEEKVDSSNEKYSSKWTVVGSIKKAEDESRLFALDDLVIITDALCVKLPLYQPDLR